MSAKLLQKISDKYQVAVRFHDEQAQLFQFLSLPGFMALHRFQMLSELIEQINLKTFIIRTFGEIPIDIIPEDAGIIEPLLKSRPRSQVQPAERMEIVKQSFASYKKWESEALAAYSAIGKELFDNGSLAEYEYVSNIIAGVSSELKFVCDLITEYENMAWDMPTIMSLQFDYFERFEKLTKKLLGKSKMFHHHNSAMSAGDRESLLKGS